VVATLVRLKARILRHTLRRESWRVVVLVFGVLWTLTLIPSVIGGMVWLSRQSPAAARDILVVAGTILTVGWTAIPMLLPGMDDSLEITRFASFGVRAKRLVPGLLVSALLSVPALFTVAVCLAPAVVWAGAGRGPLVVALLAGVLAVVTCLLLARLSTQVSAWLLGSRRSKEMSAVLGVFAAVLVIPLIVTLGSLGLEGALERVPTMAEVLGWTPFGLVWAAPAAMALGDTTGAVVRLLLALAWVVAGVWLWTALLQRALTRPSSRGGQVRRRADAMLPTRAASRRPGMAAARAITRRGLRYWTADPRYMGSLLGAVVAPLLIVLLVASVVDAPAAVALSMGALVAGSLGWGRHNDVAFDGSAFWLHVAAHVPGWADRLGRTMATLLWAAPLTVAVSLVGAVVAGRWDLAPSAVGLGVGVLCGGLGVSAVVSAVLPYPVAEAGANPYAAQMGAVGASLVAQLVSSVATWIACAPVLVLYALSLWSRPSLAPITLLVGLVGGVLTLAAAVVLGGRVYDARAPRLLGRLT
jgi:ABC-2 type transport system permease protein